MIEDNVILVDCDGVLLNWEYAFDRWIQHHGYKKRPDSHLEYGVPFRYSITKETSRILVRQFNESAAIGFIPSLRDSMYYVKRLHERHGYVFHMITSMSKNRDAQKLREMNIEKLFGNTAFEEYHYLDTGGDKHEKLELYRDTGHWWIEDKVENAELGLEYGLKSVLMEHGHNMHHDTIPLVKNWKELYELIIGE